MSIWRRIQIDPYLSPCIKRKSKGIKDFNINPVTLNLIQEKVRSSLECIGTGSYFLNITPAWKILWASINKWDILKLKIFCKAKDTVNKIKQQTEELKKSFTNLTPGRGMISKIYKELKKLDIKISNNPFKMGYKSKQRFSTVESNGQRHLRNCSTSLVTREMQINNDP